MSQFSNQNVKSCRATASISAYTVVCHAATTGADEVMTFNTTTANIVGVATDNASTGGSVAVVLPGGTAKCLCMLSVSAGALVFPATTTGGYIYEKGAIYTTTAQYKCLGVALQAGSTNSVIEVLVSPTQINAA